MPLQTAFQKLFPELDEEHPVDKKIAERLSHTSLPKKIRQETECLQKALGDNQRVWLALEASLQEYRILREEAYFDEGYAYGLIVGRVLAYQQLLKKPVDERYLEFAETLRSMIVMCPLPAMEQVRALLETAWGLCSEDVGNRGPAPRLAT